MEQYLTAQQVCDRLQISRETLRRWIAAGIIRPAITVGGVRRFDPADVRRVTKPL